MPYGVSDSILGILMESVKLTQFEDYPADIYWYQSNEGLQTLWSLITHEGATVLGIDDNYGIEEGNVADIVILDEPSQEWAITRQAARRYVIKAGNVVVKNDKLLSEYNVLV
jgi:cytosine/adenosine deaminase-related metal-dependent hydrolase